MKTELECQFKKYGFEKPDFECELFGTVSGPFEKDDFVVEVIKREYSITALICGVSNIMELYTYFLV